MARALTAAPAPASAATAAARVKRRSPAGCAAWVATALPRRRPERNVPALAGLSAASLRLAAVRCRCCASFLLSKLPHRRQRSQRCRFLSSTSRKLR